MSRKHPLVAEIDAALALARSDRITEATMRLAELARHPEAGQLGPATMLGLPRKLHSAQLKLAKLCGDTVAVTGLRAMAVPRPDVLADLFPLDCTTRAEMAAAADCEVPRILHQIWIGSRIPRPCALWQDWAARYGWAYKLWDEEALSGLDLADDPAWRLMRERADLPGAVDVARYHILQRDGGLYLDADWYPVRLDLGPDALFPRRGLSAIAEAGPRLVGGGPMLLANGLISTPPDHPALRHVLAALPEIVSRLPNGPAWWVTGPLPFTLALRRGPFTVLDSAFVAARLPRETSMPEVIDAAEKAKAGPGILLEWKDW